MIGAVAAAYIAWATIPFGFSPLPMILDGVGLKAEERASIVAKLGEYEAVYDEEDRMRLYWRTFLRPWERQAFVSNVAIVRGNMGIEVRAYRYHTKGATSRNYDTWRDESGQWHLKIIGMPNYYGPLSKTPNKS